MLNHKVVDLCFLFNLHICFVKFGVEMSPETAVSRDCPVFTAPEFCHENLLDFEHSLDARRIVLTCLGVEWTCMYNHMNYQLNMIERMQENDMLT